MKGDIADYDERATARRREGSINAFFSWFFKVAMTCSMGLGGLVLDISGFNAKLESPQPEEVLNRMFALFLVIPAFFWLCGFAIALFYPLNRNRMAEIRSELEQRRGAV